MKEMIAWAKANAAISHNGLDLIVGRIGRHRFRIFVREQWAGVVADGESWSRAKACYDLVSFKDALRE